MYSGTYIQKGMSTRLCVYRIWNLEAAMGSLSLLCKVFPCYVTLLANLLLKHWLYHIWSVTLEIKYLVIIVQEAVVYLKKSHGSVRVLFHVGQCHKGNNELVAW